MHRIYHPIAFCLSFALLIACSKKQNDSVPSVNDKTKLNSLFAAFRDAPQSFSVTPGILQTVKGNKGTKLTFYPNSFRDADGNVITTGTINLQLIEMYKPGDMIANRATTVTTNGFLASGGQIKLTATRDGNMVYPGQYGVSYANASSGDVMALYPGNTDNEDSLVTWGNPLTSSGTFCVTATVDTNSNTGALVYNFDSCTTFGFVNCDYFYSYTVPKTRVFLTTNENTFNFTNTQVFVVLPSINSVMTLQYYDGATRRFRLPDGFSLPEGMVASFIVMANKNGTFYYFEKLNQTITTDMVIDASTISAQPIDYIRSRLSAL